MESLREVYAELNTRAKTIAGLPRELCPPENKVTPELATRRELGGLFPLVVAIDECQELFSHPRPQGRGRPAGHGGSSSVGRLWASS